MPIFMVIARSTAEISAGGLIQPPPGHRPCQKSPTWLVFKMSSDWPGFITVPLEAAGNHPIRDLLRAVVSGLYPELWPGLHCVGDLWLRHRECHHAHCQIVSSLCCVPF